MDSTDRRDKAGEGRSTPPRFGAGGEAAVHGTAAWAERAIAANVLLLQRCWGYAEGHMGLGDINDARYRLIATAAAGCDVDGWNRPGERYEAVLAAMGPGAFCESVGTLALLAGEACWTSGAALRPWAQLVHRAAEQRQEARRMQSEAVRLSEAAWRLAEGAGRLRLAG